MQQHDKNKVFRLWEQGLTSTQIAIALGVTRNSVMGVVNRAQRSGIVDRRSKTFKKSKPSVKKLVAQSQKTKAAEINAIRKEATFAAKKIDDLFIFVENIPHKEGSKKIMELTKFDCRWMIGRTQYCGHQVVEGYSWCPEHKSKVFTSGYNPTRPPNAFRNAKW